MTGALAGYRVLEFAHMMQGPWAGEMLADMGADVIKVEHPSGGERGRGSGTDRLREESLFYLAMNRNKRSIALDLKSPEGREVARRLVGSADVIVENFRPGVLDRLGLGYEDVRAINPKIIYCSATGYGTGPDAADKPGQDLLAQALTGTMWLTGTERDGPLPCGLFVADTHAATMIAFGVASALLHRERTGVGQRLEIDLVGAVLHLQTQELVTYLNTGRRPGRWHVGGHPYLEPTYGVYRAADGFVALSLVPLDGLLAALGLEPPDGVPISFDPDTSRYVRRAHRIYEEKLQPLVADRLRERPVADWVELLEERGLWCAPVLDYPEAAEHPLVDLPARTAEVTHPRAGAVRLVRNPLSLSETPPSVRSHPPLLGEHTAAVLGELGYSAEEIERLGEAGVVDAGHGAQRGAQ
ncbi:MAG: CoA transferase [Streptosporangiales bacterium]|nr:CoA transferase [Streptosporangiales bacterium]